MIQLLVVADDFTGALDTGVQFAKRGIRTLVTSGTDIDIESIGDSTEVLSVNTQTRHKNANDAYEIVYQLIKKSISLGIKHVYKKTDSALRGNIGGELLAALHGAGCDRLMFVPSYPDNNRTTENGIQYIEGTPVAQTNFAREPFNPVNQDYIPDIIKQQADVQTIVIKNLETSEFDGHCGIYIFDAKTNEELVNIGKILKQSNEVRLMAGCAGFASVLPDILNCSKSMPELPNFGDNILLVSGSVNKTSIEQMNHAKKFGFKGVTLTPEQKLNSDFYKGYKCDILVNQIKDYLTENKFVYIEAAASEDDMKKSSQYAAEKNIKIDMLHLLIARNIGSLVKKTIDECEVSNLFVFGGDTLLGIIEELDINGIVPMFEICPGVVASKIISDKYSFNIITKAGSLGPKDAPEITASWILRHKPHNDTSQI